MLPVDAVLPELLSALDVRNAAVLVAPPGAGKTTRVPPGLLGASWRGDGKILVLSPRRIAARAAAARMASERNERVGQTIGYRVRLDSKISKETRIEVITEGVFTRMILDDPELKGVAAVLFDEFHERSLDGDLGLALARDAQSGLRTDLRILVMSATLDAARIASLLDDAPVVVSEGRMYSVDVRYRPRDPRGRLEPEVASAVRAAMVSEPGSALVFLPGVREIERTATLLREGITDPSVEVRPLYGALSPADQDAAISRAPSGKRKIVLATSIAETSLTIEGVRIVIDAGLTRRPHFEQAIGMARLETVRASQAAVEQRRGRAGRLEPGVCVRLWSEGETRALPAFDRPDILESDLTGLVLDLAAWGVTDPSVLTWLDPPPIAAWTQARLRLRAFGALDEDNRLTPHGAKLSTLPLSPQLAHMLLRAAEQGEALLAARVAVVLTEQGLGGRSPDLRERLHRLETERGQRADAARNLAARLARQVGGGNEPVNAERAGAVLALAYGDRVAKARSGRGAFVTTFGRAASVDETEALAREAFLVIADATGAADRARILLAGPISERDVEDMFADEIHVRTAVEIDHASGVVRGRRMRRLGQIVLSQGPLEKLAPEEVADALFNAVADGDLSLLDWDSAAIQAQARMKMMRALEGDTWPDWSDEALVQSLEQWLSPALLGVRRLKDVNIAQTLLSALAYELKRRLDAEAPTHFETPAGGNPSIDYAAEGGPALEVRLQELFGLDTHPSVAKGRVPLSLRLLSPAHRPVQTTKDLPGFWRGSYAAVRADMRGRYPKHPWPEDPLSAPPTRRAKPRGS